MVLIIWLFLLPSCVTKIKTKYYNVFKTVLSLLSNNILEIVQIGAMRLDVFVRTIYLKTSFVMTFKIVVMDQTSQIVIFVLLVNTDVLNPRR